MNPLSNFVLLIYFIGGAKFEVQQGQSDFSEFLGNFNGIDGLEPITPIRVIKEIYASSNPGLLTFLHLSFSELFHVTQMWASLNSSDEYLVKPRAEALSLEGAKALEEAPTDIEKEVMRTLVRNKDSLLNRIFSESEFSYLRPPKRVNKNTPRENLVRLVDKDKIMSSFRVQTLHNILVEGLAMLELSESNPYQRFTSDQIIWHRNY